METHCVLLPFFPTLLLLTHAGEQATAEVSIGLTQHWPFIYSHLKSLQLGTGMRNCLSRSGSESLRTPLHPAAGTMYVREESFASVCTWQPKVHALPGGVFFITSL